MQDFIKSRDGVVIGTLAASRGKNQNGQFRILNVQSFKML